MKKTLAHIIRKIRLSLGLIVPGVFHTQQKHQTDLLENGYVVITDQNNVEIGCLYVEEEIVYNTYELAPVRKTTIINVWNNKIKNKLLALQGYVIWFWHLRSITIPQLKI